MTAKKQNASRRDQSNSLEYGEMYEIKIKGFLDEHWKSWFEGMELSYVASGETRQECTLLTGLIADQPALHGLLSKIRDLNLTLISVGKISSEEHVIKKGDQDDEQDNPRRS